MDHHVPSAVTEGLRRREVEVLTTAEDGSSRLGDEELLMRATELDRVLFTQDDDLLVVAAQWHDAGRAFAGLVYAHQLRVTIGQAVRDLELLATTLEPGDMHNRVEFLPL